MKLFRKALPLFAATMLLGACGSPEDVGMENIAAGTAGGLALQDGRSLPDWHPQLPPGHPPLTQGPTRLPPGHPAVTEGRFTCPASGAVSEPDSPRVRDFKADPREIVTI